MAAEEKPGDRVRALRRALGMSGAELGRAIGYPAGQARSRISKIERNLQKINVLDLSRLAKTLQRSADYLLNGEESGVREAMTTVFDEEDGIPIVHWQGATRQIDGAVPRPPVLRGVRNGYMVYMADESMSPRYERGWLLAINPAKPPPDGRDALIIRRDGEPLVRHLERREAHRIIISAFNGEKAAALAMAEIVAIHLIVGSLQE